MTEGLPPPPGDPGTSWAEQFGPPPPSSDIAAYVEANRGRYTREALDKRLLGAGHAPDAIEAAWAALAKEDAETGRRDRRDQTAAIIGGAYVVTWFAVTMLAIIPSADGPYIGAELLAGILAVALFVPGLIAVVVARSAGWLRHAGVGRVVAFAIVPMLILFALAGTCVGVTESMG